MRIAILSDIHSNLHALEAVMADAGEKSVDTYYCLGDIIGYCASPKACLEIIREKCEKVVFGNHDYVVMYPGVAASFNPYAKEALDYALSALDDDDKEYIKALEPHLVLDGLTIAHGSLLDFNEYVTDAEIAAFSLDALSNRVLFVGHTHKPGGWSLDIESGEIKKLELKVEGQVTLTDDKKYLINAGSVGQPRDRDVRAAYVIYDTETSVVDLIRVEYDNRAAARAIIKIELPVSLAKRLKKGK